MYVYINILQTNTVQSVLEEAGIIWDRFFFDTILDTKMSSLSQSVKL